MTGEQELSIPAATSLISFTSYQQLEPGDRRRSLLCVLPDLRRGEAIESRLLVPIGRSSIEKNAKSPAYRGDLLMPKTIIMEEFHVTVVTPVGLSRTALASLRRALNSKGFQSRLRSALRKVFRQYPALKPARFTISY